MMNSTVCDAFIPANRPILEGYFSAVDGARIHLKKGLINWVMQALGVTMFINMSSITIPPQNGYPPAGKSASFIHDFPSYELPFSAGISHDMWYLPCFARCPQVTPCSHLPWFEKPTRWREPSVDCLKLGDILKETTYIGHWRGDNWESNNSI